MMGCAGVLTCLSTIISGLVARTVDELVDLFGGRFVAWFGDSIGFVAAICPNHNHWVHISEATHDEQFFASRASSRPFAMGIGLLLCPNMTIAPCVGRRVRSSDVNAMQHDKTHVFV